MATKRYSVLVQLIAQGGKKAASEIAGTGTAATKANSGILDLSVGMGTLGTVIAGLGLAKIVKELGEIYAEATALYSEQIRQEGQVAAAIKSTGEAAGFTLPQLKSMASGIQDLTTFGDEGILQMQSLLLTFKEVQGPEFKRASLAIADMAVRMGGDDPASLKNAALQVGKALNDPVANLGALGRAGIQFSKDQQTAIKTLFETGQVAEAQNIILEELEAQFQGSAAALQNDVAGAAKFAGNAWGDFLEEVGSTSTVFVPVLKEIGKFLGRLVTGFKVLKVQVFPILATMVERIGSVIASFQALAAGLFDNRLARSVGLGGLADQLKESSALSRQLGKDMADSLRKEGIRTVLDLEASMSSLNDELGNGKRGARDLKVETDGLTDAQRDQLKVLRDNVSVLKQQVDQMNALATVQFGGLDLSGPVENPFLGPALDVDIDFSEIIAQAEEYGEVLDEEVLAKFDDWESATVTVAHALDGVDDGLGDIAFAAANVLESFKQIESVGKGIGVAVAAAQFVDAISAELQRGKSTYAAEGSVVGAVVGAIVGAYFGSAEAGAAIGAAAGSVLGGLISKGADEFLGAVEVGLNGAVARVNKAEGNLATIGEKFLGAIEKGIEDTLSAIGGTLHGLPQLEVKIREGVFTVFSGGVEAQFQSMQEAVDYAILTALKNANISGLSDEVRAALENTAAETLSGLAEDLDFALFVQRLPEIGEAASNAAAVFDSAVEEWRRGVDKAIQLGIKTGKLDQHLARTIGSYRDQILGVSETVEQAIQREADAFNREQTLLRAKNDAREAALIHERATLQAKLRLDEIGSANDVANLLLTGQITEAQARMLGEGLARLAAIDSALASLASLNNSIGDLISQDEIDEAIRRATRGSGTGRRQAIDALNDQIARLQETADNVSGPLSAAIDQSNEKFARLIEEANRLRQPLEQIIELREREQEALRQNALADFIVDWDAFFATTGELEDAFAGSAGQAGALKDRLDDLFAAGVITEEQLANLSHALDLRAWNLNQLATLEFADNLEIRLHRILGNTVEAAELSWDIEKAKLQLELAQLEIARQSGYITQEAYDRIAALVEQVLLLPPPGTVTPPAPPPFVPSTTAAGTDPRATFQRGLDALVGRTFSSVDDIITAFQSVWDSVPAWARNAAEFNDVLSGVVDAFRESLIDPIRDLRDELLNDVHGPLSGREQFERLQADFLATVEGVRNGDVGAVQALPDALRAFRAVAQQYLGGNIPPELAQQFLAALNLAEQFDFDSGVYGGQVFVDGVAPTAPLNGGLSSGGYAAGVDQITAATQQVGATQLAEAQALRAEVRGLRSDIARGGGHTRELGRSA